MKNKITIETGDNGIHPYVSLRIEMPQPSNYDDIEFIASIISICQKYNDEAVKSG